MISGLLLQICILVSGFIIPKIVLTYFGSDVNGLVSSLNQFLSYITLVEGGISGVIIANLYKPLVDGNNEKLSSVIMTSDRFYKKIGYIFIIYSIVLAIIYPVIFKQEFSYIYVATLTIILSINLLIQYMFSLTLKNLLTADKKTYIVNFTQMGITLSNILLSLVSVWIYPNIHLLKLISGCLFLFQPLIFKNYANRNYNINWKAKIDNSLIKERWNGFAINFAAFVHNCTDIAILTIFTDLKTVSIYSVYSLVSNGLKQLINASISGISATVGQVYARQDYDELNKKLDIYEFVVLLMVFFVFTVAALLITPFVQLYTNGIKDTNYFQPHFGIMLLISEALYLIKFPHMSVAYNANKFKEITIPSFIEAILNIVISISLVHKLGLVGVTIGTIIGMSYRTVFQVNFTSKIIPNRKPIIFYIKLLVFSIVGMLGYLICYYIFPLSSITLMNWIKNAFIYSIIIGCLYLILSIVFFKKELLFFVRYLK
ncbi:polysaccharide biosynthesis C-terminal domain-containing protein [Dubosiella newyorkensis]|uniref:polysaccharide biosynthesis C-terminal domain-containing protein n=1 Tax=Dubosiella newyorkensis TaxID=1862672 RepID=UPI0031BB571E